MWPMLPDNELYLNHVYATQYIQPLGFKSVLLHQIPSRDVQWVSEVETQTFNIF